MPSKMSHAMVIFVALLVASTQSSPTGVLHKVKKLARHLPPPLFGLGTGVTLGSGGIFKKGHDDCAEEHIKEVQVVHEKPIFKTVIKEVPVTVVKEEPYERIVQVDRPYEVIKEIPVEKIIHVDRPVEVIREEFYEVVSSVTRSLIF